MISYEVVRHVDRLPAIAQEIVEAEVIGLDIETTGLSPYSSKIRLLQLNTGKRVYVVDAFATQTLDPIVAALRDSKGVKVGHNLKFEQKFFLHHHGLELWPIFDTYRASALIYNGQFQGKGTQDLYALYGRELQVGPEARDCGASDWSHPVLTKEQLDYAAEDVAHLEKLRACLKPKLRDNGLNRVALIEFLAVLPEAAMELAGFHFDAEAWTKLASDNKIMAEKLRRELLHELPHPAKQMTLPGFDPDFNLNSSQQLLKSLRMVGLKIDNTSEIVLAMFAKEFPIVQKILEWRGYAQCVKAFGIEFLENVDPVTRRIHTNYFPFTGAGRYASSDPNLQQIPRKKEFRQCFRAEPGKKLVVADYSQIELRIAAELANDGTLMGVYQRGEDAHAQTASLVSNVPLDKVTKAMRQMAKAVNFGLIYGMMAPKLVQYAQANYGVSMSLQDAELFRSRYFEAYSGVRQWHRIIFSDENKKRGMTRTVAGRLRYLKPESHNEFANCLDSKTEALTQRGWVPGFDLRFDDVLLTKNQFTGQLEWQKPSDLKFFADYEGELFEFRSRSFNAVTTPAHRWLVFNKSSRRNEERTSESLSLHGDHRIHRTGVYLGPNRPEFSDDFVELVGWFLTDGSFGMTGTNKTRPTANLYQSLRANPRKVEMIDALVNRMGVLTGRYFYEHRAESVTWRLASEISECLHAVFPDRRLTSEFIQRLTGQQARLLIDTMILGDGHVERCGKRSFCCGDRLGAEMFQALCVLGGFATSIVDRDMSGYTPVSDKLTNVPKAGTVYYVNILKRDKVQVHKQHLRRYTAKEPVWCPVVPNTFFVARREGQVFITGNTPVQGTGADGLKNSLRIVYERMKKYGSDARMIHMVHDEIIVEATEDPDLLKAVQRDLEEGMIEGIQPMLRKVPAVVEGGIGESWAEK